jgi:hypothetical protein
MVQLPHRIEKETTVKFIPGMGDSGRTVDIVAIADADELPSRWGQCSCGYDRGKRVVEHNPEWGADVSITCMACGSDLIEAAEDERRAHESPVGW